MGEGRVRVRGGRRRVRRGRKVVGGGDGSAHPTEGGSYERTVCSARLGSDDYELRAKSYELLPSLLLPATARGALS